MKKLTHMLMINWHYFSHSLVSFDDINFLTGQNAAGKSTLLDALQVVILGETKSYIFNKAANDKSERTLIGYLKGELGDDGDTGYRYLREGNFNAYVVLEFFDTLKQQSFLAGVVFDIYADGTQKHSYFIADCALPDHEFLIEGVPYNRDQLKGYFKHTTKNRHQWFDTQMSYRNHLMAKCGNIKHKFFSLFKKAVPFAPITDIEQFITEYITDVKGRPDIEEMQHNLRHYKRLENEAQLIADRIERLQGISETFELFKAKEKLQLLHELLVALADQSVAIDHHKSLLAREKDYQKQLQEIEEVLKETKIALDETDVTLDALRNEKAESDLQKKLQALERASKEAKEQRISLMQALQQSVSLLKENANQAKQLMDYPFTQVELESITHLATLTLESDMDHTLDQLDQFANCLSRLESYVQKKRFTLEQQLVALSASLDEWEHTLTNLKQGIKDYPKEVLVLKRHLIAKGMTGVQVLADVLEVNDDKWHNAIEGYLHTQKFYLLVDEACFDDALLLYDAIKKEEVIYNVGLIDTKKLKEKQPIASNGSLAQVVDTPHAGARTYINYTLGHVMRCEQVTDLRKHTTAITIDGMLYHHYVARQLNPSRWKVPYIGRHAIQRQIEAMEDRIKKGLQDKIQLDETFEHIKQVHIKSWSEVDYNFHQNALKGKGQIIILNHQLDALEQEMSGLDLSYLERLDERIGAVKAQRDQFDDAVRRAERNKGRLESDYNHLQKFDLPQARHQVADAKNHVMWQVYDPVREEGESRFLGLKEQQSSETITTNYSRSAKAAKTDKENHNKQLIDKRQTYNQLYHMSHDVFKSDNLVYDGILSDLSSTKLPEYIEKIKEAQERATRQFKDEFLSKLKSNFDTVIQQIKELNAAIKDSPFGTDNYRFEVKPKTDMRHFYDMIMDDLLMGDGMSIMSHAFNEKHHDAIEELFRTIVETGSDQDLARRSLLEKQITYYTDYRSYLQFDLIVKDQSGNEQRLSKTLLKKSGGETQTPFYLAVLASFAHLYRVNHKGTTSETLRLIVFDEAFSKMDQQRIAESLKLLRKFKLQAIVSAPPDKIMDIAPHVDKNLCVFRQDDVSFVQSFDKEQLEEWV